MDRSAPPAATAAPPDAPAAAALGGPLALLAIWAAGMAATLALSVRAAGGRLIYTLDDPYIHLALAENIVRGHYGVNLGEAASPSSSILYPFLLALTELAGLGPLGPAVLTIPAAALTVWIGGRLLFDRLRPAGPLAWLTALGLGVGLLFATSAFALPMTGMEHALHVLATVAALAGLVRAAETGRCPGWLVAAVVALPLLRFEGLALAGAAILALGWLGQWRAAGLAAALIAAGLATYGAAMAALGLPVLPSSVMAKHDLSAGIEAGRGAAALAGRLATRAAESLMNRQGAMLGLGALAILVALPGRAGRATPEGRARTAVGLSAVAALAAQLVAGNFGNFFRYEVYAVATLALGLVVTAAPTLRGLVASGRPLLRLALVAALPIVALPSVRATTKTPAGARNIHEQQFQMHRFATEFFPETVAVNDLGWVSYRNDTHVLDLWGLGSERARKLWQGGRIAPEALDRLVRSRGAAYAMLYPQWFARGFPGHWCPVAVLETSWASAAHPQVLFLATRADTEAPLRAAVRRFAPGLPPGARIREVACDAADPLAPSAPAARR